MSQLLRDGPSHLTVDGAASNPFVLTAVIIVVTILVAGAFVSIRRWKRVGGATVAGAALLICIFSDQVFHRLAFELHWIVTGTRIPTAFIGAPARWFAPVSAAIGLLAALGI